MNRASTDAMRGAPGNAPSVTPRAERRNGESTDTRTAELPFSPRSSQCRATAPPRAGSQVHGAAATAAAATAAKIFLGTPCFTPHMIHEPEHGRAPDAERPQIFKKSKSIFLFTIKRYSSENSVDSGGIRGGRTERRRGANEARAGRGANEARTGCGTGMRGRANGAG